MFGMREKQYFGLDVGDSSIKFIKIIKNRDGFRLGNARLIDLPFDAAFDSGEKRQELIKERLVRLFKEEGITDGVAALSISGQSVFIRSLKVPKIARSKIDQIVHYEAQLQVPFPINEVIWNYELFETYDSPETEVALVAVKKDIIESKLHLLESIGIDVDFIEVDPFCLYNVLEFTDTVKNKIVLDIGAKVTNIVMVQDKKIWTRSILMGGNDLTKAIATSLHVNLDEAEELKKKEGLIILLESEKNSSPNAQAISETMNPILIELLADISKSIGYFKSQNGGATVFREILLTGGGSKLKNLPQFIRENIDIPTKQLNLFEKIKNDIDFELTDEFIGRLDVAAGLALRTVSPLATKVNLLPRDMLRSKELEKKKWYIFGSLGCAIMIFLTAIGYLEWSSAEKNGALSRTNQLINRYNRYQKQITELQDEIKGLKTKLDYILSIPARKTRAIAYTATIMSLLPDEVWLVCIKQDKEEVIVEGNVDGTFKIVNDYRNSLINSEQFINVEVVTADELKTQDDMKSLRKFSIKLALKPTVNAKEEN